jgi:L-asparaginase
MKITFIQTGGSIDKDYPKSVKGYAFEIGEPAVKRILERFNPKFEYEIISILKKDSLDMNDKDREKILETCKKIRNDKIVITHGTDTMLETAKKLSKIKDKIVILTGATKPEKFSDSDASFNIGTAIGAVNALGNGVYIAMNGRVFNWEKCKRDLKTGQFIENI